MAAIFNISYGAVGEHGKKKRHNIFVPRGALTLAQIQAFSDDYVALLDACLDTLITDAQIVIGLSLPAGLKAGAVDGSDAGRGGRLSFSVSGSSYSQGLYLPGVIEALRVGEKSLNTAGPNALSALITAIDTGINVGGTVIQPSDEQGSDLVALVGSGQSKRK